MKRTIAAVAAAAALSIAGPAIAVAEPAQGQPTAEPPASSPSPLPPVENAAAAMEGGVERFCHWFVRGDGYSLERARQTAEEAGYRRGTSVAMIPLVEMTQQPAFSFLGFTARMPDGTPNDEGLAAFITFHVPICQIQVYGQTSEAARYVESLGQRGWILIERLAGPQVTSERWLHGSATDSYTLVVNRWTGSGPAPGKLGFILNVLPGDNRTMGVFQ